MKPLTSTQTIIQRDGGRCGYCGGVARTQDHVIPSSICRKFGLDPVLGIWTTEEAGLFPNLVAACFGCNDRKKRSPLVPASFERWLERLRECLPGYDWRVWRGASRQARTICRWCERVVASPVKCRSCGKPMHRVCVEPHRARCRKVTAARKQRGAA